jgi:hypothetical protein
MMAPRNFIFSPATVISVLLYTEFDFLYILLNKIKDAGDGKGTAKGLLDRIAELESEAERSLMHRSTSFASI